MENLIVQNKRGRCLDNDDDKAVSECLNFTVWLCVCVYDAIVENCQHYMVMCNIQTNFQNNFACNNNKWNKFVLEKSTM